MTTRFYAILTIAVCLAGVGLINQMYTHGGGGGHGGGGFGGGHGGGHSGGFHGGSHSSGSHSHSHSGHGHNHNQGGYDGGGYYGDDGAWIAAPLLIGGALAIDSGSDDSYDDSDYEDESDDNQ